ncbi:MAG: hypothetical protein A3H96_04040 [Acidobacteria bacterium RIFCSPLOWO2_02_FULL_67_36]|nr:MAG: hypothetical protein A3H96_04040 [Acidobacteria bacterium RIFCSPLOWO2_02_FULL_67_36]OFW19683.1 MAG: hypothetical protein A3G21_12925 [Acidobacteria bacterium RIFCSPLOWO2_12_FULL_66_21]
MRVVVTGGSGYLGSAIVRALARRGHDPIAFARRASAAGLPGRAMDGDVRDADAVMRAIEGADAVCHTAALVSIWQRRPETFDLINVGGLQNVLRACRALRTPRLIYTSSFLALPPEGSETPLEANDYQRTKVRALAVARQAADEGVPIVTLFPGVIYGPGPVTSGNLIGGLVRDHLAGKLPGLVGAGKRWSFAYVDDVAEAHAEAATGHASQREYLLGGENAPQIRPFETVREVTGRRLPRRLPFPVATAAALAEEARAKLLGATPRITRGVIEIFRHDWPMDSRRSVDELNYRITPLETGMRRLMTTGS